MPGLQHVLLGMGNPLLDIASEVDQGILDKYGVRTSALYSLVCEARCCLLNDLCFVAGSVGYLELCFSKIKVELNVFTKVKGLFGAGQLKLADQILAEDKHLPLFEVCTALKLRKQNMTRPTGGLAKILLTVGMCILIRNVLLSHQFASHHRWADCMHHTRIPCLKNCTRI